MDNLSYGDDSSEKDIYALEGSTTLITAIVLLMILSFTFLGCVYAMAVAMRHQAEMAADFSALAGAQKIFTEPEAACHIVEEIAQRNKVSLEKCQLEVPNIYVKVEKTLRVLHFSLYTEAQARAGPYESA